MKYHLLLLLFLLGILQIEAKSKTNDHLKDIGKRFLEIKAINRQILRWRFASRTPEETQEAKNMSAQLIANYILMQSSLENDEYSESAYVIYSLMTSDFQGGICGDEMDLNYYKFTKYWNQQRSRYHKNDFEHLTWRMIGPNDDLLYMTFLVSFKTHNIWGYSANPSYLVQTELRGDNEFSNYSITAIKEVGACTEKGTVQLNETDIVLSLYQRDPERVLTSQWIKKHVEWLFLNKIEGPVITSGWMSKTAPVGFEGTTCRQTGILNDEGIPEQYPNPQNIKTMFSWWKKFQIMYHIATDEAEPIKIQLLGDENENYVYRLTMKVQMGTRTEMPVKTFEFKIKMSKNEKNYWSINKFEVMCPPNPDITLKQQHLENYNQILIKKIKQMNETGDSWYLGTDVLKELFHPTHAEFTKCNITQKEKVASLESLQQSFFDERFSYKHIYEMAPDSVNEYGHLEDEYESVYWDIEMSFDSPNERSWALVKWRFTMEWSDDIQFYEVTKLDIGCARLKAKENFSYSGVRGLYEMVCPDNERHGRCSIEEDCPKESNCYRDILVLNGYNGEREFGCCSSRCPVTNMPYGTEYDESTDSMIFSCSSGNISLFYQDKTKDENRLLNQEYGCCPLPYSDFTYGKKSGKVVNESYSLPTGWSLDFSTGKVSSEIHQCCTAEDCNSNQYCGRVRNPIDGKLVEKTNNFVCAKHSDFDKSDGKLSFCYTYPEVNYTELGISENEKLFLDDRQLCLDQSDCWNSSHYCHYFGGNNQSIGSCFPLIGNLGKWAGAEDAFIIPGEGCQSDEECDEQGFKWFSYRCQPPIEGSTVNGSVCVGYESICSESALYLHGTSFGCKSDKECEDSTLNYSNHSPACVTHPVIETETACCYEMSSCRYHLDIHPYGIPPLNSSMCLTDSECQDLAENMMRSQKERKVLIGRCMEEIEGQLGKCCISDISSLCPIGKSLIPPIKCSDHPDCGLNEKTGWCGDKGFCCRDFDGDDSWMCPDQKTIRLKQPECEEEGSVTSSANGTHLWAESPWYYHNLTCQDTVDLPPDMDMIYCDPKRQVVTRMTRGDQWMARIQSAFYRYCSSNQNCSNISSDLVCVQETNGLYRCHTYYDRPLRWYFLIIPTIILMFVAYKCSFEWWNEMERDAINNIELYM